MLNRSALAAVLVLSLAAPAWADLAPEPTDPSGPYFWVALLAAVAAATGFLVWCRRKK